MAVGAFREGLARELVRDPRWQRARERAARHGASGEQHGVAELLHADRARVARDEVEHARVLRGRESAAAEAYPQLLVGHARELLRLGAEAVEVGLEETPP